SAPTPALLFPGVLPPKSAGGAMKTNSCRSPRISRIAAAFQIPTFLHFAQSLFKRGQRWLIKENEVDFFQRGGALQVLRGLLQHNGRAFGKRKTADARADGWKRDRAKSFLGGDAQGMRRGTAQGTTGSQAAKLHARRMNHVPRFQLPRGSDGRPSQGNRADRVAFPLQGVPGFSANHASKASAEFEVVIGGVDDGVGGRLSSLALLQNDFFRDTHSSRDDTRAEFQLYPASEAGDDRAEEPSAARNDRGAGALQGLRTDAVA